MESSGLREAHWARLRIETSPRIQTLDGRAEFALLVRWRKGRGLKPKDRKKMVTERSTLCVTPECLEQRVPTTDYCAQHQRPQFVWMVIHEFKGGNEAGSVVSIWTEKAKADAERHRLRGMTTVGSAWDYVVHDAPLNVSGTMTLN